MTDPRPPLPAFRLVFLPPTPPLLHCHTHTHLNGDLPLFFLSVGSGVVASPSPGEGVVSLPGNNILVLSNLSKENTSTQNSVPRVNNILTRMFTTPLPSFHISPLQCHKTILGENRRPINWFLMGLLTDQYISFKDEPWGKLYLPRSKKNCGAK